MERGIPHPLYTGDEVWGGILSCKHEALFPIKYGSNLNR